MTEKMNLEAKVEKLIEKRKSINSITSFQEIFKLWEEIKTTHAECQAEIKDIQKNLETLNSNQEEAPLNQDFNFDESFNEIKAISENIKTCSISEFPEKISKMKSLKSSCLKYLDQEKAKIEEIKS